MIFRLTASRIAIDVGIAAAYLVVAVYLVGFTFLTGVAVVTILAIAIALRRVSPLVALAVCWFAALLQMYFAHIGPMVPDLGILPVLYTTAAYGNRVTRSIGFGSVFLGAVLGAIYFTWGTRTPTFAVTVGVQSIAEAARVILGLGFDFVVMAALLGIPWAAGYFVATRVAARASLAARDSAEAEAEAAEADVIVEQERNRIARDMHDVVAHSLAVVIAQADGARYARETDPVAADEALTTISATARDALADVRLLLGQLRHSQSEGPQPALADLSRLLDQLRASGLTIAFETKGDPLSLGTGQQLAVYRIVQEALTNVLRHGDTSHEAVVRFEWNSTELELSITSAVTATPATAELRVGHGLAGMKERAALVGGQLHTEVDDSRFIVMASIPASVAVRS
jgi:signal transduction histidine kinase